MKDRKNRSIRWRVPFKTLHERDAMVCIYDENYSGNIIDLEGAINPITTEDDKSEELLSPVRAQTGYLRIIDNGDIKGLVPDDNMQHYVELYINDVLEWCGYMQADSFSEDWDATPIEVEYPLISGIGVLDGLYLDQNKPFGDITLAAMMKECFDMANIEYDYIYVPAEVFPQGESYSALLRLSISRFNFFKESGSEYDDVDYQKYDSWKALDVVAEICKFFGWTIYERSKSLYIVSHGGDNIYKKMNYSDFGVSQRWFSVETKSVQLENLNFDSDTHTKDILQGYNMFKILASSNPVGDVVPIINEEALGYKGIFTHTYKWKDLSHPEGPDMCHEKAKLYGPGNSDVDTEMFQYEWDPSTLLKEVSFDPFLFYQRYGACYGEYDLYTEASKADKKNYDYKKAVIVNLNMDGEVYGISDFETQPFLVMRNKRKAKYRNGAFVLDIGSTTGVYHLYIPNPGIKPAEFKVYFRMRCEDKYWDGAKWTTQPSKFMLQINAQGKIDSNKTLDMPYNGANGYVMPITGIMSGDVELTMYCPFGWDPSRRLDRIYFQGLKVQYYPDDNEIDKKQEKDNKYQSMVEATFKNSMDVELKIASYNQNVAGYGLLLLDNDYVQSLYYTQEGNMRPEKFLLSKLKRVYGRNIERLNIEVERTNLLPYDIIQYNKKRYAIASVETDWSDEHQKLTILDVV